MLENEKIKTTTFWWVKERKEEGRWFMGWSMGRGRMNIREGEGIKGGEGRADTWLTVPNPSLLARVKVSLKAYFFF